MCLLERLYSTQQGLLALLEKWKRAVDSGQIFGALLIDLSKAFDCPNYWLQNLAHMDSAYHL